MKVSVAANSGFCSGVSRAFHIVKMLVEGGKTPVQTYGELVHNPDVVAFLENNGVSVANSIDEVVKDAHVVVRAHGIPDSEMESLKKIAAFVYDGKCPIVGNVQNGVRAMVEEGYFAVVYGKLGHAEMVCVTGDLPDGRYVVAGNLEEAREAIGTIKLSKVYLCAQTTKNPFEFDVMAKELAEFCNGRGIRLESNNTTCKPTGNAKVYARELAEVSDAMVVVGGKNSENTQGLVSVCESVYAGTGKKVISVVNGREMWQYLKDNSFNGVKNVGVAAGTSTPPWVIDDVCNLLRAHN